MGPTPPETLKWSPDVGGQNAKVSLWDASRTCWRPSSVVVKPRRGVGAAAGLGDAVGDVPGLGDVVASGDAPGLGDVAASGDAPGLGDSPAGGDVAGLGEAAAGEPLVGGSAVTPAVTPGVAAGVARSGGGGSVAPG
jgi:hypothetical protein